MARPLSEREREVLDAFLSVDFDGVESLRRDAEDALVIGGCGCGCPSIDFYVEPGQGLCMHLNAAIDDRPLDGLFLFSVAGRLGGIEWVGASDLPQPSEFPHPSLLSITPAQSGWNVPK